jgi:uncharacterized protein (DUF302 family)
MDIGITAKFPISFGFEKIEMETIDALKENGFGVLTEIDVKDIFMNKLGIEFNKYKILGACNPPKAHQVISAMPEIGLLLPCNVIVYEKDEEIVVSAVNPLSLFKIVDNTELVSVAEEVHEMLTNTMNLLKSRFK